MSDAHLKRVSENLLPRSRASTLVEALKEWAFTDRVEDHEEAIETCQLCGQEELRYHFEIANRHTNFALWVGSHCILKFQVAVWENGRQLSSKKAKQKLDRLTEEMRFKSCLKALGNVASKEGNSILTNALDFYRQNEYLTPKYAFVVLWRLRENSIDHNPSFFKINLKRSKYKEDLSAMSESKVRLIWPALTSSQRELAVRLGHQAM